MTAPAIGCIVHYVLTEQDALDINRRRLDFRAFSESHRTLGSGLPTPPGELGRSGHVGHYGNVVTAGDVYPAMIVRRFGTSGTVVNLQVFLDGNDQYWATSREHRSDGAPGTWSWPVQI